MKTISFQNRCHLARNTAGREGVSERPSLWGPIPLPKRPSWGQEGGKPIGSSQASKEAGIRTQASLRFKHKLHQSPVVWLHAGCWTLLASVLLCLAGMIIPTHDSERIRRTDCESLSHKDVLTGNVQPVLGPFGEHQVALLVSLSCPPHKYVCIHLIPCPCRCPSC